MLIKPKPLQHWINNFYGYGSWRAPVWFVAHEEGGGDLPEEVAEKLDYFYSAHPSDNAPSLCDIRELYSRVAVRWDGPKAGLFQNFAEFRFGSNATLHGVWKNLIAFRHAYSDDELPDLLHYQKNYFASPESQKEALLRLYPLPAPHNHGWYYSWLDLPEFPFLKSRMQYQEHVFPNRMQSLLESIRQHRPELVVMYGMENINLLKTSFQRAFQAAKFNMVKAVKLQIPQHHVADLDGTILIITTQIPALRHGRIETGFDWMELGKIARSYRVG